MRKMKALIYIASAVFLFGVAYWGGFTEGRQHQSLIESAGIAIRTTSELHYFDNGKMDELFVLKSRELNSAFVTFNYFREIKYPDMFYKSSNLSDIEDAERHIYKAAMYRLKKPMDFYSEKDHSFNEKMLESWPSSDVERAAKQLKDNEIRYSNELERARITSKGSG